MSSKSQKRVAAKADTKASTGQKITAYSPASAPATRGRTGAGNAVLLIGGMAALLLVGLLGVFLFAPQILNPAKPLPNSDTLYSPEGRIAFVRTKESKRDLYVVNPDGTNQQQVTEGYVVEGSYAWSPDGKRIVAQVSVEGVSTLVRVTIGPNNRPSDAVQLTADVKADSANPAWSPDGTLIAFQSKREGGEAQIFVMDPDGNGKRRLSDNKGYAGQPAWSPDGKTIVYVGGENQGAAVKELYTVPLEGGEPKGITQRGSSLSGPRWTSDGDFIVFIEGSRGTQSVIMTKPDGTSSRVLAEAGRSARPSPDGSMVVFDFVSQQIGGSRVFTVPIEGSEPTNLTGDSQSDYLPDWSPDGKRLTWLRLGGTVEGGGYKVVVANADGSNIRVVSTGEGDDFLPQWGPAPK